MYATTASLGYLGQGAPPVIARKPSAPAIPVGISSADAVKIKAAHDAAYHAAYAKAFARTKAARAARKHH